MAGLAAVGNPPQLLAGSFVKSRGGVSGYRATSLHLRLATGSSVILKPEAGADGEDQKGSLNRKRLFRFAKDQKSSFLFRYRGRIRRVSLAARVSNGSCQRIMKGFRDRGVASMICRK